MLEIFIYLIMYNIMMLTNSCCTVMTRSEEIAKRAKKQGVNAINIRSGILASNMAAEDSDDDL